MLYLSRTARRGSFPLTGRGDFWQLHALFRKMSTVGDMALSRPELGIKRTCQHCGARFYDLARDPIVCPKCGHEHTADMFNRMKRTRPVEAVARAPKRGPGEETAAAEEELDVELDDVAEDEEDAEFEDASELGEDDDDMAEVVENLDEDESDEDLR